MEILITVLIMILCLVAEAFFSGSEIGTVSADRMRLRHDAAKGSRGARLAIQMLKKPEWLLSTTLVGTNIAVVTNTTLGTALMIQLFGESMSWLAIVLVAPLIWVFGEIVPKSIFQQHANQITPKAIFVLRFFSYLFFPILVIFSFLTRLIARALGGGKDDANPFTLREEIQTMMDMSPVGSGDIRPMEKNMIRRMFEFREKTAGAIMIPLIDMVAIERGASSGEVSKLAEEKMHKLFPVYEKRIDKIVGVINSLELVANPTEEPIENILQKVTYVPSSKSIKSLLMQMRMQHDAMAVVVDEFGGAQGIVTLEDIMEEVVEELEHEYRSTEEATEWVRKLGEQEYLASARIDLKDLWDKVGIELPPGKYTTLAGFLLEKSGEVPDEGTEIEFKGTTFEIQKATPLAIQEVRIHW
ncbi:MAG: HlyC/CorC family transporter [Gammaproteobacteria bacterium]|nr:HlyC/CorC family transporter [Gammaproteobacteria bacterium]